MEKDKEEKEFIEGIDYYFENGLLVFTKKYLEDRGFCCENGCRNCPYGFDKNSEDLKNPGQQEIG